MDFLSSWLPFDGDKSGCKSSWCPFSWPLLCKRCFQGCLNFAKDDLLSYADESKTILGNDLLQMMKSSAILISIVHGLFSQELILNMVNESKLFGFGFEAEPGAFDTFKGNVWAAPSLCLGNRHYNA